MAQQPKSGPSCLVVEFSSSHTVNRHTHTPYTLNEKSARRRNRLLTQPTQETNIHALSAGFEAAIPATMGMHTYALDRTATGSCN
jgi:hypothetical protein